MERGPLSLVIITEELLEWKSSSFRSRKSILTAVGDPLRWSRDTFYPQKLAITSPTCGGHSVGIVCLRTKATEFSLVLLCIYGSTALCGPWPLFQFPNIYTVDKTPCTGNQPSSRPLPTHRTTRTQNKRTHRHLCLEWDSNPRSQIPGGEDGSYVSVRGHGDR
jgi:hypothetical protein